MSNQSRKGKCKQQKTQKINLSNGEPKNYWKRYFP